MKMTQQEIEAFVLQYHGIKCIKIEESEELLTPNKWMYLDCEYGNNIQYIELRSIESLTDEECIQVARYATHVTPKESFKVVKIENGKVYFTDSWMVGEYANSDFFVKVNSFPVQGSFQVKKGEVIKQDHYQFPLHAYDYLRSIGIAVPFRGHSVEKMIEQGILKLKTNE